MSAIPLSKSSGASVSWKKSSSFRTSRAQAESDSGKVSNELMDRVQTQKIETVTYPPDNVRLKRELADILQECSIADWDGYGSKPINRTSVDNIVDFLKKLQKLPDNVSCPELAPEPTGDLTMVWRKKGYHLIVGIDAAKQIAWGGTSPKGHVYGDAKFDSDIPEELIDLLYSVEGIR
jgi:hypothetical protein